MRLLAAVLIVLVLPVAAVAATEEEVRERIDRLASPDAGARFTAAVELGRFGDRAAVPPLLDLLEKDSDLFVRRAAARSLGALRDRRAVPGLIEALTDAEIYVSLEASKALKRITGTSHGFGPDLTPVQRAAVQEAWRAWWKSNPTLKPEPEPAAPAPAKAPPADVEVLLKQLADPDAGTRFKAAVELGRSRDLRAVGPLGETLVKDGDLFVRRACARSLGELRRREAVPKLIDALTDEEIFVAIQAARSLRAITGREPDLKLRREGARVETVGTLEERVRIQAEYRAWWTAELQRLRKQEKEAESDR